MAKPATTDGTRTADPTAWWRHAGFDIPDPVRVARLLARRPELEQELRDGLVHIRALFGERPQMRLTVELLPGDTEVAPVEQLWVDIRDQRSIADAEEAWEALMDAWGEEAYRATEAGLCIDVLGR